MARLAAVDVGSNTVHALVVEEAGSGLVDLGYFVEMPEIGRAAAATGRVGPEKTAEAVAALESVVGRARELGYEHLVAGATEAVRRAADRDLLLGAAEAAIGVPVRLIAGEREAELSFEGVASRSAGRRGWVMVDLGGSSTEVVAASGRELVRAVSLPIGSGAFSARHLSDPPAPGERASLRAAAVPLLAGAPDWTAEKLVVTGGTASNLPLVLSRRSPPSVLNQAALLEAARRLDAAPAEQLAPGLGLAPARVRALRGGVEMLLLLLDFYGLAQLHVSHAGLRHGMILAWRRLGEDWWR